MRLCEGGMHRCNWQHKRWMSRWSAFDRMLRYHTDGAPRDTARYGTPTISTHAALPRLADSEIRWVSPSFSPSFSLFLLLQQHPDVQRAAVVGVPDERWGEAVVACIIPNAGARIDDAALIAFARERLAGFETPKRIVVMEEFPTTVGGKILKYRLREALAASN